MSALVAAQPKSFDTQEDAIAWQYVLPASDRGHTLLARTQGTDSATDSGSVHSRTINNLESARVSVPPLIRPAATAPDGTAAPETSFVWRVKLEKTEPYWRGA